MRSRIVGFQNRKVSKLRIALASLGENVIETAGHQRSFGEWNAGALMHRIYRHRALLALLSPASSRHLINSLYGRLLSLVMEAHRASRSLLKLSLILFGKPSLLHIQLQQGYLSHRSQTHHIASRKTFINHPSSIISSHHSQPQIKTTRLKQTASRLPARQAKLSPAHSPALKQSQR